jgi:hypothetical protein
MLEVISWAVEPCLREKVGALTWGLLPVTLVFGTPRHEASCLSVLLVSVGVAAAGD